ncbi:RNA polymerase sigma factor [Fulvimonas soli]|jgi:RNA polymerase sigma-70 factor (ECF subfamily)|uniref:RNA polymerase sigma-70 factor (ECF subfamily) n=1 Tax=Fulvimonas soli TaxID=155197 RepID=A0A316IEP7_9GAMM|nr:RNA polymerase sigma factor [Fulvimonas soli]PWK92087.1 RNA polymerase sigma-70 factor (ECF subfamily) [Fulvimonas soli]TNY26821.1 RNA polymerase subunit sigma-70 [Fulvimonas soli]
MTAHADPQRFQTLLRAHERIVFKVAALYAAHAEDRRDLAQEIGLQAWRSFARYDERRAKFSTWLYRVALNVAISQLRKSDGAQGGRLEPLEQHHLDGIGGEPVPEPDERLAALYAFIGRLDALNRALILLYLEDKSHAEIAEILGISTTNVATKIGRIKQTLRGQMAGAAATGD